MQRTREQNRGGQWNHSNSPTYFTPLITGQAVWRECGSSALPSGCKIGSTEAAVQDATLGTERQLFKACGGSAERLWHSMGRPGLSPTNLWPTNRAPAPAGREQPQRPPLWHMRCKPSRGPTFWLWNTMASPRLGFIETCPCSKVGQKASTCCLCAMPAAAHRAHPTTSC